MSANCLSLIRVRLFAREKHALERMGFNDFQRNAECESGPSFLVLHSINHFANAKCFIGVRGFLCDCINGCVFPEIINDVIFQFRLCISFAMRSNEKTILINRKSIWIRDGDRQDNIHILTEFWPCV